MNGERDRKVKLAVIEAVSKVDDKQSLHLLRFQTTARDPEIKRAVVQGIRRLAHADGAKALKILLRDRNPKIQWEACLAALELEPEMGLSQMKRMLRNPPDGFMADIETLDEDTRTKILEHLLLEGNTTGRAAALRVVRQIGEPLFSLHRKLVVDAETPDNVRRTLLLALSEKRAPKDKMLFEKLVRDAEDKPIRRLAAWTLAEWATEDLEASFRGYLSHDDKAVQAIAAYGLAAIND